MSSYETIDEIIEKWVIENNLFLLKFYKEDEVRSVDYLSQSGEKFQIWIDPPIDKMVTFHVWNYKKFRKDKKVVLEDLLFYLNETIFFIKENQIAKL